MRGRPLQGTAGLRPHEPQIEAEATPMGGQGFLAALPTNE
jgi:hypothetical protein